ncbi:hypothetical protein CL618_00980 [archaeon]|nr:hypothetical protein [archaeon]|tara:strand:+ start:1838 stop:2176 length:339 start_codon:yes stop_codon:yes gene_type:complete
MVHNRNKLIDLFIGNISNSIVHKILEKAIDNEEIVSRYEKELLNSWEIAKKYREKINPKTKLPEKDIEYVKDKIIKKVRKELVLRISKGYENIDLNLIEKLVDESLEKMEII